MQFLESPRLLLRPLIPSDLDHFYEYRSKPSICRYQGFNPMDRLTATTFIQEMQHALFYNPGHWYQIAIWSKEKQHLVGDCALIFQAHEPRLVELGCTLNDRFQGQGLATEAMELLLDYIFAQHKVHKAKAVVDPRNTSAIQLLERLDFQKEGHLQQNYFDEIDQGWVDEALYGKVYRQKKQAI